MDKIKNNKDCCGCTACESICAHKAIKMQPDKQGFEYPSLDTTLCNNCGLCTMVCPIVQRSLAMPSQEPLDYYAARNKDNETLKRSSSGGVFNVFAKLIIERNGVVVGAIYDKKMSVVHAFAETILECRKMHGSKYSQSRLNGVYIEVKKLLNANRLVLFTGTPCQVDGLKNFLRKDYLNLITIDLICHSIPSPLVFSDYLGIIEGKFKNRITELNLKDKSLGWPTTSTYYKFENNKELYNPIGIKSWQDIFESGYITRPSCFDCRYTNLHRPADITIGDFWDFDSLRPDLRSSLGTSVLLVNSEKGREYIKELNNDLELWHLSKNEAMQPRLERSSIKPKQYETFWEDYISNGFTYVYKKFFTLSFTRRAFLRLKGIIKK